jgi:hypothetical protein
MSLAKNGYKGCQFIEKEKKKINRVSPPPDKHDLNPISVHPHLDR